MKGIICDSPETAARHYAKGVLKQGFDFQAVYAYLDAQGQPIYWRIRCKHPDGRKWIRPLHLSADGKYYLSEPPELKSKQKPLYGLHLLAQSSQAMVWGIEGEKCADELNRFFAAHDIAAQHVAVTSGSDTSAEGADWTPLRGRQCRLWPDNDQGGIGYAEIAADILKGIATTEIIDAAALGLAAKGDCVDWLAANPAATVEDMLALPLITGGADDSDHSGDNLFDVLKARAVNLGKGDHDAARTLLEEAAALDTLARRALYEIIKARTGFTLGDIRKAMAEIYGVPEPDHLVLAREVIDHVGKENLLATVAHVWRWRDTGVWRSIPDLERKQSVQHTLERNRHDVTRGLVDAVAEVLKTEIFAPEHEWDRDRDAINFLNGELHRAGEAWELRPHCREHYRTTQIPHIYDPDAKCPRFILFLSEIFKGDTDGKDKATLIVELLGYTLISSARLEKFILLIGPGANGKSVVLDVIRVMVGADNVAAVQPSQLGNKFQRAHLHLKLANLVTEIAEGAEIADAELKATTSGELMTAEHKFGHPFDFRPFCTCWFGTNHLPHTRDFSDALFRRAVVIQFNQIFKEGVNADPLLKDKLAGEMPGIINLSLQAFGEVLKRGRFTEPESCKQAKQEWRIEADQVAQFMGDICDPAADAEIESGELYGRYKTWAESAGITRKLSRKNFTIRIARLGGKPYKGTAGKRMIAGIRLKSILDQEV